MTGTGLALLIVPSLADYEWPLRVGLALLGSLLLSLLGMVVMARRLTVMAK